MYQFTMNDYEVLWDPASPVTMTVMSGRIEGMDDATSAPGVAIRIDNEATGQMMTVPLAQSSAMVLLRMLVAATTADLP